MGFRTNMFCHDPFFFTINNLRSTGVSENTLTVAMVAYSDYFYLRVVAVDAILLLSNATYTAKNYYSMWINY